MIDKNIMDNEKMEENLPPQGIQTPSGRREGSMVPLTLSSSSSAGPTFPLLAGGKFKMTTVEEVANKDLDEPLEMTFVECRSFNDEFGESQDLGPHIGDADALASCSKTKGKRKARVSPGAISPSDEEKKDANFGKYQIKPVSVVLRKLRPKKKLSDNVAFLSGNETAGETSPARVSTNAE